MGALDNAPKRRKIIIRETNSNTDFDNDMPISSRFPKAIVTSSPTLPKDMKHFARKKKSFDADIKAALANAPKVEI